jgi:hypothetical protein
MVDTTLEFTGKAVGSTVGVSSRVAGTATDAASRLIVTGNRLASELVDGTGKVYSQSRQLADDSRRRVHQVAC